MDPTTEAPASLPPDIETLREIAIVLATHENDPVELSEFEANVTADIPAGHISPKVVRLTSTDHALRIELGLSVRREGILYGAVFRVSTGSYVWVPTARWITDSLVRLPRGFNPATGRAIANFPTSFSPIIESRTGRLFLPDQLRVERRFRERHWRQNGKQRPNERATFAYRLAFGFYHSVDDIRHDLASEPIVKNADFADHDVATEIAAEWGEQFIATLPEPKPEETAALETAVAEEPELEVIVEPTPIREPVAPPVTTLDVVAGTVGPDEIIVLRLPDGRTAVVQVQHVLD